MSAGTTVRQFDYRTGRELYLNYDAEGNLYNSAYNDDDVNVLLKPDGSLNATLVNPDAEYDWQQIAQSVPQEFADTSQDQPIVLNKGDEQLTLNADGSTVLANFDTDRALHFDSGATEPNAVTHADGSDLSVGDGLHDFGQGAWDGARSLVGLGPYGTGEAWKGFGSGLGTVIMYLPHVMSDGIHGAANMGNPAGYQHPNREDALFEALTGVKPDYIRTSPSYAVGMLAGAGIATAIPGAGGALTKALRPGLRAGEHAVRPSIGETSPPNMRGSEGVHPSSPVGNIVMNDSAILPRSIPMTFDGVSFSGHAVDRLRGRGIPPTAAIDAIQNGQIYPGRGGAVIHFSPDNNISVVVNGSNGRVVTVEKGKARGIR
ncbi:DUF4258 domain-containing protein [Gordonia sp. MP11Mi]|uniref:DUF4258 domain-containing protein n=1 Tax=Gordonia sp. MP11Mi TaxID=3022769 RepID=A0AA97CWE3_9ACTN